MTQPNFVIFLADDQGYGDVGCYGGHDLQTPHLDRLAREGVRCAQWHGGSAVCSASRAVLLTGRAPHRVGVPGNVGAGPEDRGLSPAAQTLPQYLREAGYQTFMAGKWHLGQHVGERPHQRGFDHFFGFLYGCIDYYSHIFYWSMANAKQPPIHDLWRDDTELFLEGQYVTDLIANEAVAMLRQAAADPRPFLLYLPFNAPHYPMHAPAQALARFGHLGCARQLTAALLWCYDQAIGRVLDELDALGLTDNTCVFASADHGPSRENRNWPDGRLEAFTGGSTGGLRGEKFSLFDGGIRVPGIWRYPGVLPANTVTDTPLHHIDVLPTFMGMVGDPSGASGNLTWEGLDARAILTGEKAGPNRVLGWSLKGQTAVRQGRWKLLLNARCVGQTPDPVFLVDLDNDPAERVNVAQANPGVVQSLTELAQAYRAE